MADPWELILHHSYAGSADVIFDLSPGRAAHGTAVNLTPSDYLADGASPGSGAVNFNGNGRIRVAPTKSWDHLGGIRAEVAWRTDYAQGGGSLIDAGSFKVLLRPFTVVTVPGLPGTLDGGTLVFNVRTTQGPLGPQWWHFEASLDGSHEFPAGQWLTCGVLYDGISTCELSFNGATLKSWTDAPLFPVMPTNSVTIGNGRAELGPFFKGQIDDVKVWRVNPHRVDDEFTGRPVDQGVKDCWGNWTRALNDALKNNRECAVYIRDLIVKAIQDIVRQGVNHDPATTAKWDETSDTYRQLWAQGDLGSIGPAIAELISVLRAAGIDPTQNPDLVALANDKCLQIILAGLPSLKDCDPQFTNLLGTITRAI